MAVALGPGMRSLGRRLIAASVVASLAGGCAGRHAVYGLEVGVVGIGVALASIDPDDPNDGNDDFVNEGPVRRSMVNAGIGLIVAGLAALVLTAATQSDDAPSGEKHPNTVAYPGLAPLSEPSDANPDAVRLAQRARHAALRGECIVVRQYAERVQHLDDDYYEQVFREDPPLRACL